MLELERHKNILKYLYDKQAWIKGKELAEVFDVSDRTVRTDITSIKKIIGDEVILSSKANGYRFNKEYDIKEYLDSINGFEPSDRLIYIAKKLILYENGLNIYELAEELFVSDSTINSDILRLKKIIEDIDLYRLELFREGELIQLSGKDHNRNSLLSRVIKNEKTYIQNEDLQKFFPHYNIERIVRIEIEKLEEFKYTSRFISIRELTINALMILERNKLNYNHYLIIGIDKLNLSKEYDIAYSILKHIEKQTGIQIDNIEINNFAYLLWTSSELENEQLKINGNIIDDSYMSKLLSDIMGEIKDEFYMDLTLDDEFLKDIVMHTKIAMKRIYLGVSVFNPIRDQMIAEHPFLFDVAIYLAKKINDATGIFLNREEISFLVAHIGVAVEKVNMKKKLNVLLIVFEGRSALKHILKKISDLDKENVLNIYAISSPYNMEEIIVKPVKFDMVISTSQFTLLNINQDIVINPQFTIVDELSVRGIFEKKMMMLKSDNFRILFKKFFHEDIFINNMQSNSKEQTINKLCEILKKNGYVDENFRNSVYEREELISTALDNRVSLPHATNVKAIKSGIAISIMNKSVNWSGKKVKVVFLFAIDKDDIKNQREVYDFIVKLVCKDLNIEELIKCKNLQEFQKLSERIYIG